MLWYDKETKTLKFGEQVLLRADIVDQNYTLYTEEALIKMAENQTIFEKPAIAIIDPSVFKEE